MSQAKEFVAGTLDAFRRSVAANMNVTQRLNTSDTSCVASLQTSVGVACVDVNGVMNGASASCFFVSASMRRTLRPLTCVASQTCPRSFPPPNVTSLSVERIHPFFCTKNPNVSYVLEPSGVHPLNEVRPRISHFSRFSLTCMRRTNHADWCDQIDHTMNEDPP